MDGSAGDVTTEQQPRSVGARNTCLGPERRQERLSCGPGASSFIHRLRAGGSEGSGIQPWCLWMTERETASPGLSGAGAGAVPAPAAAAPSGLAAPHLAPHFTPFGLQNTVWAGRREPEPCGEGRQVCLIPLRAPALRPGHSGAGGRAGGTDPGHGVGGGAEAPRLPEHPGGPAGAV